MKPSELLRKHGWCQGTYQTLDGRCCVVEALLKSERHYEIGKRLRDHLGVEHLPTWNDTPGRTADEVIAALEAIGE